MGVYRSDPEVFAGYARDRYGYGVHLVQVHTADRTGRCVSCGVPAPCRTARVGEQVCRDYADWATSGHPRGVLVRPYVRRPIRGGARARS